MSTNTDPNTNKITFNMNSQCGVVVDLITGTIIETGSLVFIPYEDCEGCDDDHVFELACEVGHYLTK